jgi:hypothetical protein
MAKAVTVREDPDAELARRFGADIARPENGPARISLQVLARSSNGNLWTALNCLFADPPRRPFAPGAVRGCVAWLRARDAYARFFNQSALLEVPYPCRRNVLRWIEQRETPATLEWVLDLEQRDTGEQMKAALAPFVDDI